MKLAEFRRRLHEISNAREVSLWWLEIEALREEFPHSIIQTGIDAGEFNCFAFALGLHRSATYYCIALMSEPNIFANSDFVSFLIRRGVLAENMASSGSSKLLVYFEASRPTHAGIISNGRVVSKWGNGLVLEHDPVEVPSVYGDQMESFPLPGPKVAEEAFLDFCRERGLRPEDYTGG
jgi:hypothetical protein